MFAMEVRTGKTITSLMTCQKTKSKGVLFVTTKKAIPSIKADYKMLNPGYPLQVINYASLHKITDHSYDTVIVDECHKISAYPKPAARTKALRQVVGHKHLILLSGTPTPESYSQFYHEFWISERTPFVENSFYKWANIYVNKKILYLAHGRKANDYSDANYKLIMQVLSPYIITFTQKQGGFASTINEAFHSVPMLASTYALIDILEKDLIFEGKGGGVILGDTPVKLLSKVSQLYSGTIKLEDGSNAITDRSKANYIKQKFHGKKIAIFYIYKAELELLKETFFNNLTTDLEEFNTSGKNIALQVVSGREGISLKAADCLVMYNIQHSAVSYWQSRDRMTTKERTENTVNWIFAENGIEQKIYEQVKDKKSFTTSHYTRSKSTGQTSEAA